MNMLYKNFKAGVNTGLLYKVCASFKDNQDSKSSSLFIVTFRVFH